MNNLLQYRGCYGSIETSAEDNYEGETVAELQAAFREAVDDYLATCCLF